ncbi:MAG: DUF1592 domain-containing protein [Rhodospirillaceae bacterium]
MTLRRTIASCGIAAVVVALLGAGAIATVVAAADKVPAVNQKNITVAPPRRLTPDQYANVIRDAFGTSISLGGRFEPDVRADGLVEIGTANVSVSSVGMAQFDAMARAISSQVLNEENRDLMMTCAPKAVKEPDDACASEFLVSAGGLLFRRPLSEVERRQYVEAAQIATKATGDFYTGLSLALSAMLESPQFLFRQASLEPDPESPGQYRLDGFSKASRLSFFLWNSMPDAALFAAAEKGELHSRKGLERQVARMMASPRLESGIRAFFSDMFHFDAIAAVTKDATLFPRFDAIVLADAKEQTLRTVVDVVLTRRADYREVFTTRKTYLSRALASMYEIPLIHNVPIGSPDEMQEYEYPADDPRAGILTHISFLALHSHPGRSSPTLRGKAVREVIMCQRVPPPPGAVNSELLSDTGNPKYKTVRDRLTVHQEDPVCAGCHRITDPIGLALENFNGAGEWQSHENGVPIDASGTIDGAKFTNAVELGKAIHDHPATTSCVVDRLAGYALGRAAGAGDRAWVTQLKQDFAKDGHKIPELIRQIALSPEFYSVSLPEPDVAAGRPARGGKQ